MEPERPDRGFHDSGQIDLHLALGMRILFSVIDQTSVASGLMSSGFRLQTGEYILAAE